MTVFASQIATAQRLIAAKGAAVTWRSIPDGVVPDPEEPWNVQNASPIDNVVKIVFLPFSRVNTQLIRALGGTEIETGDCYGLMAAVEFTPQKTDVVIDENGVVYRVQDIDILQPDLTPILYTIGFKL